MGNMRNWMLGAAVVAGGLGLGATSAQAAEFGVYARGPVAFIPRCPGPGYIWIAGYQANGYWIPGRWAFQGFRDRGPVVRSFVGWGRGPVFERHFDRDRDHDHFRR
jgi:hypothetical protein